MADNCKYRIKGIDKEFSEDEMKAYLANGGKAEYERIKPKIEVSEKNQKQLDKWVNGIIEGKTTQKVITDYINAQNYSDETKRKFLNYISQEVKELKKDTYQKLEDTGKRLFDSYEDKYLNGEMTYEEVMHQLGSTADRQKDPQVKAKYESIRNAFFKEHSKRNQAEQNQEQKQEFKNFNDELNNSSIGLSEDEWTVLESDTRLLRDSDIAFKDDYSYISDYDQIRAAFTFDKFSNDANMMIIKFQQQYGDEYLKKMLEFVKDEKNKTEARIAVSVTLNRQLYKDLDNEDYPNKALLYTLREDNNAISQKLGSQVSIAMNMLRGWNSDIAKQMAWVGVVNPDLMNKRSEIIKMLGDDITDEDLIASEDENIDIYAEDTKEETEQPESKKAGYFKRKAAKKDAKLMVAKDKEELKKKIEEQEKKCK